MLGYITVFYDNFTAVAVLGIALISMGEEVGADMSYRAFGHLVSVSRKTIDYITNIFIWHKINIKEHILLLYTIGHVFVQRDKRGGLFGSYILRALSSTLSRRMKYIKLLQPCSV